MFFFLIVRLVLGKKVKKLLIEIKRMTLLKNCRIQNIQMI